VRQKLGATRARTPSESRLNMICLSVCTMFRSTYVTVRVSESAKEGSQVNWIGTWHKVSSTSTPHPPKRLTVMSVTWWINGLIGGQPPKQANLWRATLFVRISALRKMSVKAPVKSRTLSRQSGSLADEQKHLLMHKDMFAIKTQTRRGKTSWLISKDFLLW